MAEVFGPCVFFKIGSYPHLVVSSAQAAKEAFRLRDSTNSSRPMLTPGKIFAADSLFWTPYGDYWRKIRKVCTLELLTSKQIELSRADRAEEMALATAKLMEASKEMRPVDLSEIISDTTYSITLRKVVGKSYLKSLDDEAIRTKHLLQKVISASGEFYIGDTMPWLKWLDFGKAARANLLRKEVDAVLQKQIDERRKNPGVFEHDFVSILLQNELLRDADDSVKAIVLDMIGGGADTTAETIEWAMSELINNPIAMAKLQDELFHVVGSSPQVDENHLDKLAYLSAVVKETLRLHPPGAVLIFQAAEDCQVLHYSVPKDTRVFINVYKIARDACSWEDPLTFKPERFLERNIDITGARDYEMLPFGSGRRGCPGIQLGLRVAQFILANLVHGFKWRTPSNQPVDMSEGSGLTIPRAVPLTLVPTSSF